jgi:hypothetical protein
MSTGSWSLKEAVEPQKIAEITKAQRLTEDLTAAQKKVLREIAEAIKREYRP